MPSGATTVSSLGDSLPVMLDGARIVREYAGIMPRLVDRHTLADNTGTAWDEISLAQLTAQGITETTILENPQTITDTLFSISPVMVGIHTLITDRVRRRVDRQTLAKIGPLAQNAIQRRKDLDGLTILEVAATSLGGAGTTLNSGIILAAVARAHFGEGVEPSEGPVYGVLHSFQMLDLQSELTAGIGTYPVPAGMTAEIFRNGFSGSVSGAEMYVDDNIARDSGDDARGGVFARMGIVLIQGKSPWMKTERREGYGGGADLLYHYDEYAYGERSAGNWVFEILSDAASPTSA